MERSVLNPFYSLIPKLKFGRSIFEKMKNIYRTNNPFNFIEGCRQSGKAKRDQGSIQAHKGLGGLPMHTLF